MVLYIKAVKVLEDVKTGDSIAVNGVCLTVTAFQGAGFTADIMRETMDRSSFAQMRSGSHVNLERAIPANGRFGGHIVAGHVDGVGKVVEIRRDGTAVWYTVQAEPSVLRYIIRKGSIAIDGVSLTVAQVFSDRFSVSAIPHTVEQTVFRERKEGDLVNLENDMIGKYVEKLLHPAAGESAKSTLTKDFLIRCGY